MTQPITRYLIRSRPLGTLIRDALQQASPRHLRGRQGGLRIEVGHGADDVPARGNAIEARFYESCR